MWVWQVLPSESDVLSKYFEFQLLYVYFLLETPYSIIFSEFETKTNKIKISNLFSFLVYFDITKYYFKYFEQSVLYWRSPIKDCKIAYLFTHSILLNYLNIKGASHQIIYIQVF